MTQSLAPAAGASIPPLRAGRHPTETWQASRARTPAGVHGCDAWIAYRHSLGVRPLYLQLSGTEGQIVGVGVAYLARSRFRPWRRPTMHLDRLPWPVDGADLDPSRSVAAVLRLAQEQRCAALTVDSFEGPSPPPDLAAAGFDERCRYEFVLDLRAEDRERFDALKSSHRRKIRKAEKSGLECADETVGADLSSLASMQEHTRERRSDRGEEMSCPRPEQYQLLAKHLIGGGGARLFVARIAGKPVSTLLIGTAQERAYYLMGGTNAEGLLHNAASLLMWQASGMLRAAGHTLLNLGGVPARAEEESSVEHGLFRFKAGFGSQQLGCRSGTIRLRR